MSDSALPHRRSIRLREYDYSLAGAYFVTVCTTARACILGRVLVNPVKLTTLGEIAQQCWDDVPQHYPTVDLDAFIVMPNHVHRILVISDRAPAEQTGEACLAPTVPQDGQRRPKLGSVMGSFKAAVTKAANEMRETASRPLWQRGYYEHVIRSEVALARIREYIEQNPSRWTLDHDNPTNWR